MLELPTNEDDEVGEVEADLAEDDFGEFYLEGFVMQLDALPAEKRKLEEEKARQYSRDVRAKLQPRKYCRDLGLFILLL